MVSAPARKTRKTSSKKGRSPAKERRSTTRTQSAEASLLSPSADSSPSKAETPRTARYSHRLPTEQQRKGNGRVAGRNLIMWNRPRMHEKLLLHIQFECNRHKVQLPWDAIAHRLHPGSSGAAIVQRINRLRRELVAEGHLVPPPTQQSSTLLDSRIRGYVRQDTDGDDFETTRAVRFDEKVDDPKLNLPGDFSNLDEDYMEPRDARRTPSVESEYGDYRQESPTPMSRTSSKSSNGSTGSFETFPPQFVAPIQVVRDTRVLDHPQLEHFSFDEIEKEPSHVRQSSHGSETGLSILEESAPANESFDLQASILEASANMQQVPHHNIQGLMNGYTMATFPSWPHPFMYPLNAPQHTHSPAHSFEHGEYSSNPFPGSMSMPLPLPMPMAVVPQCNPFIALDPNMLKQEMGQSVPTASTRKAGTMQVEPNAAHSAQHDAAFIGLASADTTKAGNLPASLAAVAGSLGGQTSI